MITAYLKRIKQAQNKWAKLEEENEFAIEIAVLLLEQYAKSGFFNGHWNSHHVTEVKNVLSAHENAKDAKILTDRITNKIKKLVNPRGRLAAIFYVISTNLPPEAQPDKLKTQYVTALSSLEAFQLLKRYSAFAFIRFFRGEIMNDHVKIVRAAIKNFDVKNDTLENLLNNVRQKLNDSDIKLSEKSPLKKLMNTISQLGAFKIDWDEDVANLIDKDLQCKLECTELTEDLEQRLAVIHSFLSVAESMDKPSKLATRKKKYAIKLENVSKSNPPTNKEKLTALNNLTDPIDLLFSSLIKIPKLKKHISHVIESVDKIESDNCNKVDKAYFGDDSTVRIFQKLNAHAVAIKQIQTKEYGQSLAPSPRELAEYYQINNEQQQMYAFLKVKKFYRQALTQLSREDYDAQERAQEVALKFFDAALRSKEKVPFNTLSKLTVDYLNSKNAYRYVNQDFDRLLSVKLNSN